MEFEDIIEVARPPSIFDVIILLFKARLAYLLIKQTEIHKILSEN